MGEEHTEVHRTESEETTVVESDDRDPDAPVFDDPKADVPGYPEHGEEEDED